MRSEVQYKKLSTKTYRKTKTLLQPHGHHEHKERHAGRGGEECWRGDEHARRGGGQKKEKPSSTSAQQTRPTELVT